MLCQCQLTSSELTFSVQGCSRASVDEFMGDLVVRWPGVTHRVTLDAHQTAEHLLYTTIALAKQPSTDQVIPRARNLSRDAGCVPTSCHAVPISAVLQDSVNKGASARGPHFSRRLHPAL